MTEVFCPWLIAKFAKEKGMSQGRLAEKVGVTRQTVNCWIHSKRAPSTYYLPLIAKALDRKVADFFDTVPDECTESD